MSEERLRAETPQMRLERLRGEFERAQRQVPRGAMVQLAVADPMGEKARLDALIAILRQRGLLDDVEFDHQFKLALGDILEQAIEQLGRAADEARRMQLVTPAAHEQKVIQNLRGTS